MLTPGPVLYGVQARVPVQLPANRHLAADMDVRTMDWNVQGTECFVQAESLLLKNLRS